MKKVIIYTSILLIISAIVVIGIKQSDSPFMRQARNLLCTSISSGLRSGELTITPSYAYMDGPSGAGFIDGKYYRTTDYNQNPNGGIFSGTYELKKKLVSECYGGMCLNSKEICEKIIINMSGSFIPNPKSSSSPFF